MGAGAPAEACAGLVRAVWSVLAPDGGRAGVQGPGEAQPGDPAVRGGRCGVEPRGAVAQVVCACSCTP